MAFIWLVAYWALQLYLIFMWARLIVDLVQVINRNWRPRGIVLVLIEVCYSVTDPPIKFFRRIIPPLRLGPVALDFGWTLTFILTLILISVVSSLA